MGCPNDYISEKFVTAGVANNRSIQIPSLIQAALNRRKAGMIGEGENIRLNVQTQTSMTYIHNSKHVVAKALHDAVSSNHSPGHWSWGLLLWSLVKTESTLCMTWRNRLDIFGVGFISVGGFTWLQLKVPGKPVTGSWFVSQDGYKRPFRQCGTWGKGGDEAWGKSWK